MHVNKYVLTNKQGFCKLKILNNKLKHDIKKQRYLAAKYINKKTTENHGQLLIGRIY